MKYNLIVKDLKKLSNDIYQDENCIDDEKMANEIVNNMVANLVQIYKLIDKLDDLDFLEKMNNTKLYEIRNEIDLYQLGDIMNLLNVINIKECE